MSKTTHSVFEYVDPSTGQWNMIELFEKRNGEFAPVQFIHGGHGTWLYWIGEVPMTDEDSALTDRLDGFFRNAQCRGLPVTASSQARNVYCQDCLLYQDAGSELECLTFTLLDLEAMELLCHRISRSAVANFSDRFSEMKGLLAALADMKGIFCPSDIRVILWQV